MERFGQSYGAKDRLAVLILQGPGVRVPTMDVAAHHLRSFLEEVDRRRSDRLEAPNRWYRIPDARGAGRVLIGARSRVPGESLRGARSTVDEARRGLSMLCHSARRPPPFSDAVLEPLWDLLQILRVPGMERMIFHSAGQSQFLTLSLLDHIREVRRSAGASPDGVERPDGNGPAGSRSPESRARCVGARTAAAGNPPSGGVRSSPPIAIAAYGRRREPRIHVDGGDP